MRDFEGELWQKCIEFHGHSCPGLAIGFQVSRLVLHDFDVNHARDEELVCVIENDACGVDAIQYITGCTLGKGNLVYRPTAKQAYSFFERENGKKVRYVLERPDDMPDDRDKAMDNLLGMDPKDLFIKKSPHYQIPDQAGIFDTIECAKCGEGAAEYAVRLQEGEKVCLDCFDDYSRQLDTGI